MVPLTALGGCFCVNNSCGTNLVFANTPTIMNVIGGGVAGAIQKNDSRYAISNVVIDGMDATYYGQNSGGCVASSSGPANAEQYYYNPGNMSSDAAAQAAEQAAVPTSVYSTLKTSDAAGNYQTATCTIARGDAIAWDTNYQCFMESGITNGCSVLENNSNCQLRSENIDGVTTVSNYMATGLEPLSSCQPLSSTVSASCEYSCPLGVGYPCTGTDSHVHERKHGRELRAHEPHRGVWRLVERLSVSGGFGQRALFHGTKQHADVHVPPGGLSLLR